MQDAVCAIPFREISRLQAMLKEDAASIARALPNATVRSEGAEHDHTGSYPWLSFPVPPTKKEAADIFRENQRDVWHTQEVVNVGNCKSLIGLPEYFR